MDFFSGIWQSARVGLNSLYLVIDKTNGAAENVTETVGETTSPGSFLDFIPTVLIWGLMLVALYFLLIRPQRKKDKQMVEMQQALKVGDKVLTSSGFYGKIVDVGNDAFIVEFGDNRGVRVPVRKSDILGVKSPDMSPPNREQIEDKKDDKKEDKK